MAQLSRWFLGGCFPTSISRYFWERASTTPVSQEWFTARTAQFARTLRALGFGVLVVEYRGYGASRAEEATEQGLYLFAHDGNRLLLEIVRLAS